MAAIWAVVLIGLVLVVIGLGLGVTLIMLPAGVVVGLAGLLMVVGGLFARIGSGDHHKEQEVLALGRLGTQSVRRHSSG